MWPVEAFELSGEISSYDGRGFCPRCGSRLVDTSDPGSTRIEIRLGSLDDAPFELTPEDEIWVKRREGWLPPVEGAAQHDEGARASLYEVAGGDEGLLRLAEAWHSRVMADAVVGHAFSHGFHPQHSERLAAYWAEALGGPTTYSDTYGDESAVVRIHSGNGLHEEMDRRAIACFDQALDDVGLAEDERLRQVLHDYFSWATRTNMSRYHQSPDDVPEGLSIPHWSWDGLQR